MRILRGLAMLAVAAALGLAVPSKALATYFWLPVDGGTPVSAYYDLDRASGSIRDWTGWTGTAWVYGHAYDQHTGTDYDGVHFDPIYNAQAGTVMEVHYYPYNTYQQGIEVYGTYIRIDHSTSRFGQNYITLYAHLDYFSPAVWDTLYLASKQQIAEMGNTGNSSGSHLHWGVWSIDSSSWICPYATGKI